MTKEVTRLFRFLKALIGSLLSIETHLHRFHHVLLPIWFSELVNMFLSAEGTDEAGVEAEAGAGDPADMVRDHCLGPRLGHHHALLNARADALPRIQGLRGVEAGQGTELRRNEIKEGTLIVEANRLYVASFPIFLYICYCVFSCFLTFYPE
ncbi:unnamed protein product [Brassica oleracea]